MGTTQSFSERAKAELDMINLHLKLASMEAKDDLENARKKMAGTVKEVKDYFNSLADKEEDAEVKESATKVRTKAEVIESIMEMRNERLAREEKEIDTEASEAVDDFNSSVKELFDNSYLGNLKQEFENKFENKLFEINKYLLYQDKYQKLKEAGNDDEFEAWIVELKSKKDELENN